MQDPTSSSSSDVLTEKDLRAPRYTSYPTALAFHSGFGDTQFRVAAQRSKVSVGPLSLYVHVPFCASNCYYCGCHRVISRSAERIDHYIDTVLLEASRKADLLGQGRVLQQLHLGGGTPNALDNAQMQRLLDGLRAAFRWEQAADFEASLEVDPRRADALDIHAWRHMGFKRLSFGVQDMDENTQRAINRVQSAQQLMTLTLAARQAGFQSINYDLVYGLPLQTAQSYERTLDFVIRQRPDRVAAYHYAHLPQRFRAQRAIPEAWLPDAATRQALRQNIHDRLTQAGYVAIGLDHYCLPQDSLATAYRDGSLHRNFQGYSTQAGCELVGLGVSSISQLSDAYAQNEVDERRYREQIEAGGLAIVRGYQMTDDDRIRAAVIQAVMCRGGVRYGEIEQAFALHFERYFSAELQRLEGMDPQQTWLLRDASGFRLRQSALPVLRVVASVFDRYCASSSGQAYSKVA